MGKQSPGTGTLDDPLIVDEQGNLVNYQPYTEDLVFSFSCPKTFGPSLDLATGEDLTSEDQEDEIRYTVKIRPGGGKMIFVGPPEEGQKALELLKREPAIDVSK